MRPMPLIAVATIALLAAPGVAAPVDQSALMRTMLAAHNAKRARHRSPPLAVSARLQRTARTRAETLCAACSTTAGRAPNGVGENIYSVRRATAPSASALATEAADAWYAEVGDYDFTQPGPSAGTEHFTQMVWSGTTEIGCAMCRCPSGSDTGATAFMMVCEYAVAGNMMSRFSANVRPSQPGRRGPDVPMPK